jgi:hypothetical protein
MHSRLRREAVRAIGLGILIAGAGLAFQARGSEGGASFYLLGSGGPEAAILPPLPGVFFSDTAYYYSASASGSHEFVVGGNVVAGLDAKIAADFATVLWAPTTNLLGGTLVVGGSLPVGQPWANVSVILTGPLGNQFGVSKNDTALVAGDPVLTAALGWKRGDLHVDVSTLLNVPIGDYRSNQLANLAFHRWADDLSVAATWHDDKSGWDVSGKTGFTFNGENPITHYRTGTEWHVEGAIEKILSRVWALGVQSYYFDQVSGDSGAGAKLGAFEGRVVGIGGFLSYGFKLVGLPATLRLHGTTEFDALNRLQGHTIWLDFSMPLHLRLPRPAPG